jgi:hypothetical protein
MAEVQFPLLNLNNRKVNVYFINREEYIGQEIEATDKFNLLFCGALFKLAARNAT